MNEKRFRHFGLWVIDDPNLKINTVADLFDTKIMSIEEVVDLLNEQQDTIFKLQDLCGKSDGENMKLRIENKRLEKEVNLLRPTNIEQYEQIQKLQEENEKLRKELGDCEKFRYQVFKRLNDEYIKERSIK